MKHKIKFYPILLAQKVVNEQGERRLEVALNAETTWSTLADYVQKSSLAHLVRKPAKWRHRNRLDW